MTRIGQVDWIFIQMKQMSLKLIRIQAEILIRKFVKNV